MADQQRVTYSASAMSWLIPGVFFAGCSVTFIGVAADQFSDFTSFGRQLPDWFTGLMFGVITFTFLAYLVVKPKRVDVKGDQIHISRLIGESQYSSDAMSVETKNLESSLGRGAEFLLVKSPSSRFPSTVPLKSFRTADRANLRALFLPDVEQQDTADT